MVISPGKPKEAYCGHLHIPSDRNVIEAAIKLPQKHFGQLINSMVRTTDRAIVIKITLDKTLVLDHQGCLLIEDPTDALIKDLIWTFPLK
jgi:hypothetical protein